MTAQRMQIAQACKLFGINAQQLKAALERHGVSAGLGTTKVVKPEWLAALVAEFGPLEEVNSTSLDIKEASDLTESAPPAYPESAVQAVLVESKSVRYPNATSLQERTTGGKNEINSQPIRGKRGGGQRSGNRAISNDEPADKEVQIGRVIELIEEKRGFICTPGSTAKLHFPGFALIDKVLPTEGEWVLFAYRPLKNNPFRQEIHWVRPLGHNIALLRRVAKISETVALEKLLEIGPAEVRLEVTNMLVDRLAPASDGATLATATRLLEHILKWAPNALPDSVDNLLKCAAPDCGWRLWLRYRSPLAETPEAADRLVRLLEGTPTIVADWWPAVEQQGLLGVCLAYALQGGQIGTALLRLKPALGPAQALLYDAVLAQWLDAMGPAPDAATFYMLRGAARSGYELTTILEATVLAALSSAVTLEVWLLDNEAVVFPRTAALDGFGALPSADQARTMAKFTDEEFATVLESITRQSEPSTQRRATAILNQYLLTTLAAFGLDLESDRQSVKEIAWGSPGNWSSGKGAAGVATSLAALQDRVADGQPYLVVGHNVRDFDAPILAEHGVMLAADSVWDTLLVEMALSPHWRVFALDTKHAAEADAALALKLFQNQALRLVVMEEEFWQALAPIFSSVVQTGLNELRARRWGQWLTLEELWSEAREWLRPQPTASTQLEQLRQELAGSPARTKVVLAARTLWGELGQENGMQFLENAANEPDFCELQLDAVLHQLALRPVEAVLAARFFDYCRQAQLAPVPANMAPAVRVRLQQHVTFAECYSPVGPHNWQTAQCICLTVEQLLTHYAQLRELPELAVLVVAPDLITLGHKRLLLDGLSVQDLLASERSRTEWVKFSGGQSFMGLTRAQVEELGVAVPIGYHRFWLEKHRQGSYRVWGSFDWEPLLAAFAPETVRYVSTEEISFQPEQLTCVAVHAQRLQQRLGVTAFNPESIYRARYWLLQAELLASIGRRGAHPAPTVLLVQRGGELTKLAAYFRKLGYYVPEPEKEASLGRQLELLHESANPQRLVIAPLERAAALLQANYRGPLEVVVDSFNLLENFYLAQGSSLFERTRRVAGGLTDAPGEPDEEGQDTSSENKANASDESKAAPKREYLARDLHFLLELQQPVVQQLRTLVVTNDQQSRLWLLDPRIEEFGGLATAWQMKKSVVDVSWADTAAYEAAVKQADEVFGGARPARDFELNVEAAKKLLAQVFLRFREKGQWVQYDWKTEQLPYLDKILPAETDLLVSLPTGGGKSLLFQAPALYRSAYTNRLSIVVTPLKALMEDQVEGLWKRGFYSSVEYLNQDKQDETQQIYRRLAGGELALLFITPERFRSRGFAKAFAQRLASDGGLEYAIYDEAHCISQWGHEFRPDYLHSARMVENHRKLSEYKFPVLLFSATVTEKIYEGFNQLFG